jgi:alkylation response protein AidB-like acyl-CoA dehydrogenase
VFDHTLNDEQKMLRDAARDYCDKRLRPNVEAWDHAERVPDEIFKEMTELGYFSLLCPEEYGGMALDAMSYAVVHEEFNRASAGLGIIMSVHNSLVGGAIKRYGTDEQKTTWLTAMCNGKLGAYCLSEPNSGTDAGSLQLSAKADGDSYVLNGEKMFVTNADYAKFYLVFTKTNPAAGTKGITAVLVDRNTPGVEVGKPERKMGIKCSDTRSVAFSDVRVPKANRLGDEGQGFKIALSQLDHGRIGVAIQGLAIGEAAFEEALKYSKQREQFGKPICEFQAVAFKLADMRMKLDATRLLVDYAVRKMAAGERVTREASEAKLFASETANWVTDQAVQIHGGYGYMKEYAVERYFRDARITEIYEGTSEAQRIVISRAILNG